MGALQELWEFSCIGGTGECHYICPLYLNQVGGSLTQVLWPTYEVATVFLDTSPTPILALNKRIKQIQQGTATCTWSPYLELTQLSGSVPGCHRHLPGSNQPAHPTQCRWPTESASIKHYFFKTGRDIYFV